MQFLEQSIELSFDMIIVNTQLLGNNKNSQIFKWLIKCFSVIFYYFIFIKGCILVVIQKPGVAAALCDELPLVHLQLHLRLLEVRYRNQFH